jgi:death on curing protein
VTRKSPAKKEPRWVSKKAALAIHGEILAEHGGKPGIRDEGLLEAAMEAPKNHFAYEQASLFRLAAVYACGICQNHPFVDGNKRVALMVMYAFLGLNRFRLDAPEEEAHSQIDGVAAGRVGREGLEAWIEASSKPRR